jgi:hypothetical protein
MIALALFLAGCKKHPELPETTPPDLRIQWNEYVQSESPFHYLKTVDRQGHVTVETPGKHVTRLTVAPTTVEKMYEALRSSGLAEHMKLGDEPVHEPIFHDCEQGGSLNVIVIRFNAQIWSVRSSFSFCAGEFAQGEEVADDIDTLIYELDDLAGLPH